MCPDRLQKRVAFCSVCLQVTTPQIPELPRDAESFVMPDLSPSIREISVSRWQCSMTIVHIAEFLVATTVPMLSIGSFISMDFGDRASMAIANSSAYSWNREFFDRQIQKYPAENSAAVAAITNGSDLIREFLSASGEVDTSFGPSAYQTLELEPLCSGCSMDDLISGEKPWVTKPMAFLDDRCRRMHHSEPAGGHKRRDLGALSSSQLLKELRKRRYGCENETDAARRLLYVANPDCWVIMVLASTASINQVAFLADFFYSYLGSRTSLSIHRPARGPLVFALEFHLQFFVWCEGGKQFRDPRKKRNGRPLRQSRQLNYLTLSDKNEPRVNIYEAQVSCLITGIDEDSWVAYQFADTYYQGNKPLEQVEEYGVKPDPLTAGLFDANLPIWTPREYFLIVYECRLKQVRHAMHNLVARLVLRLEPYTQDEGDVTSSSDEGVAPSMAQKQSMQQVLNEANRFLPQTIHSISKTAEAWDRFSQRDIAYLADILRSDSRKSPIPSFKVVTMIEDHIDALRDLQRRAEEQRDLCAGLARKLEMQIVMEDNEVTARQQEGSEMIKYWTGIGLVFLPLTAVAAIFSMQPVNFVSIDSATTVLATNMFNSITTKALLVASLVFTGSALPNGNDKRHWVGTWASMPQEVEPANLAPAPFGGADAAAQFQNTTLRQTFHMSIGAEKIRIRFSNIFGKTDLPITAASIALPVGGKAGVGQIDTKTTKQLKFKGKKSVSIPAGQIVYSDPIDFKVKPLSNLALSVYTEKGQVGNKITGHPGSRTTSWMQKGNHVNAASVSEGSTKHWYFANGVDSWAPKDHFAVVLLGDSITDGRGSTDDTNDRWSDALAAHLQESGMTNVAVNNMAAGGNAILSGGLGPPLLQRYKRDALEQPGAKFVVVFEGVNDIGPSATDEATQKKIKEGLIAAYIQIAKDCKQAGMGTIGATITQMLGNQYYAPEREATRVAVNEWILNNRTYDHTVDFASLIGSGDKLLSQYDSGDGLHPNPAAYKLMANAFTACTACRRLKRKCSRDTPSCRLICDYGSGSAGSSPENHPEGTTSRERIHPVAELNAHRTKSFPSSYFLDSDFFQPISRDILTSHHGPFFIDQQRHFTAIGAFDSLVTHYEATIHQWLPMLSIKRLKQDANFLANTDRGSVDVLIFLALEALMNQSSINGSSTLPQSNPSYLKAKHYSFIAESGGTINLRLIQTITLIASYEIGHRIYPAAYLTVGQAVRLATMIGLHSQKEAKQLFVDAETWTLCEEQRRTWWTIAMLDRVIVAGSPELLMAAPDPSTNDLLPCNDDDWKNGKIGFNEALFTRNFHSPSSMGQFARVCQAVHMFGKVLRHIQARKRDIDPVEQTAEALQIHIILTSLEQGITSDDTDIMTAHGSLHTALSLCSLARLLLYNEYACNEPNFATARERLAAEVEMQQISLASIQDIVSKTIPQMAHQIVSANEQESVGPRYSPILASCLYHAATECAWFVKENNDVEMVNGLESITQALEVLKTEWTVCGKD
ncbi:hypothetical protein FBEOM_4443 [Fusarium beomiforme]|uniref:Xylanolytic transcriptional activator regulatory domain-containing protein n=1 Tax=Fusarium beomiforme TaxID=44412 RepID=A0A9P5AMN5_9HYPO|nr:hypothetical protein FBEOM_4443 [Fusarium beomiforme]